MSEMGLFGSSFGGNDHVKPLMLWPATLLFPPAGRLLPTAEKSRISEKTANHLENLAFYP
jgi:hypothetical protein